MKFQAVLFSALVLFAGASFAISDAKKAKIAERLKPVGEVCVEGDSCAQVSMPAENMSKSPEKIYNTSCLGCHSTGAGGAPKVGDSVAWSARIAQGSGVLYDHAIQGFNAMPAMGLCMSCSKDDIKATVDYMVKKSQ